MNLSRKFRPKTIDGVVGHEQIKKDLKSYLETRDPPHMMFIGPPGIGKNCLAYAFATEYLGRTISVDTENGDKDYLEINASKDRGIDTVREIISDFAETPSDTYYRIPAIGEEDKEVSININRRCKRVCVLDEVDSTTKPFQLGMRSVMEKCENNCIFILCMNNEAGIVEPALFSRCAVFRFSTPRVEEIANYFYKKAREVGVTFKDRHLVVDIVKHYRGDFRMMLNDCLEALRGYNKEVITKEDLYKIYEDDSKAIARIIHDSTSPKLKFKDIWEKENFNVRSFLQDYFELVGFKHARVFAKVDSRLRRGCNEMIQISYLMSELGL
jgi:replication factor C small subunit